MAVLTTNDVGLTFVSGTSVLLTSDVFLYFETTGSTEDTSSFGAGFSGQLWPKRF